MTYVINPYRFGGDSLLTGLVAWWELNETSGTRVNNHNPGTHDLTDENTVLYEAGKQGNAASFVATNSERLYAANHADLRIADRDFTCVGWSKFESTSEANGRIVGKGLNVGTGAGWAFSRDASNQEVRLSARDAADVNNVICADIAITYSTWFFFIVQFTAATDELSIEVNRGTPSTATLTGGSYTGETSVFAIGAGSLVTQQNLEGAVDEVAIWHRLLTVAEKNRLYAAGAGMAYPG